MENYRELKNSLALAAENNHPEIVSLLLPEIACVSIRGAKKEDILDILRSINHYQVLLVFLEDTRNNITSRIKNQIKISIERKNILSQVIKDGNYAAFISLASHGARLTIVDEEEQSLLDQALYHHKYEIAKFLIDKETSFTPLVPT